MNVDDVLDEIEDSRGVTEAAPETVEASQAPPRGYDKRVVYGGAAAALAVFIGFSFLGGAKSPQVAQPPPVPDVETPLISDPPYAAAARRAAESRSDSASLGDTPVPPPSSAVIGGADGRPYETVASAPGPAGSGQGQGSGSTVAAPAGTGPQAVEDPRLAAWRAVRDAAPTSRWGTAEATVGAFDPATVGGAPEPSMVPETPAESADSARAANGPSEEEEPGSGRPVSGSVIVPALTRIDAALVYAINSDVPGDVVAQVSRDVIDESGTRVAIPAGSRLIGKQSDQVAVGQRRLVVAWSGLQLPDRTMVPLPALAAGDAGGAAGLAGQLRTGSGAAFGRALLLSGIGAGFQLSQPSGTAGSAPNVGSTIAAAVGQQLAELSAELLRRDVSTRPTIRVQAGSYVAVLVTAELRVPARRWARTGAER
ncbi:MAG TPA: TrbI/VirB10 family protein [Longimicrobium sp.]|nr:TrbI/VirB10 family protein [Longimicrobium sp.]